MADMTRLQDVLSNLVVYARENSRNLSSTTKARFIELIGKLGGVAAQRKEQPPPVPVIPDAARLLWIASGSQPSVFAQYLMQYPDPSLDVLRQNRNMLSTVMEMLEAEFPKGQRPEADGVQKAWVPSSNIWGFRYDPASQSLIVKFNGERNQADGPVYQYSGVPAEVYEIFRRGAVPAKTTGSNQWGNWWQGKEPSLGASMSELIKKGGYAYQRLR